MGALRAPLLRLRGLHPLPRAEQGRGAAPRAASQPVARGPADSKASSRSSRAWGRGATPSSPAAASITALRKSASRGPRAGPRARYPCQSGAPSTATVSAPTTCRGTINRARTPVFWSSESWTSSLPT
eukprot:7454686-Pyramimonas_sp.AAC.1